MFLADLLSKGNHEFWPDDVRLLASAHCDIDRIRSWRQVTDTYLLSLAVAHGGKLATFDRRLVTDAVKGGRQALHVIEP